MHLLSRTEEESLSMKFAYAVLTLGATLSLTTVSNAATITFTGNESDFTSQSVVAHVDGIDTEGFCGANPLDIENLYITHDNTNVYIGMKYARGCFCDINLAWAIDVAAGGTPSDPFCRQIDWSSEASPPDYYVYDVIPTNCNGYNYEVLYHTNGSGGWSTVHDGANGLGIVDSDGGNFVEMAISWADLGFSAGAPCNTSLNLEAFVTQEGCSKPAFDMVANDAEQRSSLSGTCFDVGPGACDTSHPSTYVTYSTGECGTPVQSKSWGSIKSLYR